MEPDGSDYIVTLPGLDSFSYGNSLDEAALRFLNGLVEELESLSARKDRLGSHLQQQLGRLRQLIAPTG